jgi:hypothetical protein
MFLGWSSTKGDKEKKITRNLEKGPDMASNTNYIVMSKRQPHFFPK